MVNRNFVKKVMVLAFAVVLAVAPAAFAETEAQTEEVTIIGGADSATSILLGGWEVNSGKLSIDDEKRTRMQRKPSRRRLMALRDMPMNRLRFLAGRSSRGQITAFSAEEL